MTLKLGTRLGRYEIRSRLCAGGMGEVYLAEDTRLHRKVALKILPAEAASDRKRMQRFVQEAKAASALNHPNILTIYEIEESDAVFDGTLRQALAVQLEQTPFLNLFPDERVRETLWFMNRSSDERITREVAREVCLRRGLKAMVLGSIANLGNDYVITLEAVNAETGEVLARPQGES